MATLSIKAFINEARRRRVFRVVALYIVGAWVALQIADLAFPGLGIDESAIRYVWIGTILGFPIALVIGWRYDIVAGRIVRTAASSIDAELAIGRSDYIILAALAVVVAMIIFQMAGEISETQIAETNPVAVTDADPNSIAVLPFVNISSDEEQEYFSDGLSEELLNLLARIPELNVAARTSSFSFKGKDLEILEIASHLKVAHILEGSVRKSGNQIRITAQLIQADNGYNLWSESYDRELDNIFQIQEEIAIAVVNALKITLLGDVPKTRKTDPQAYQLFLEGQYLKRHMSADSLSNAIEAFKQAVEIDPTYVPAWTDLADTYLWLGKDALADQAIQTAISADPDYAYTYYVRGVFRIFSELRFKEGIEDFRHALRLDPDDAFIIAAIGKGAFITGDFDLAIQQYQAALRVEPVAPEFYYYLGLAQRGAGRFDDAEASFRKMLSLSPQYIFGHALLWETLLLKGDLDAALAESQQIVSSRSRRVSEAITHFALGNEEQSDSILVDLVEESASAFGYKSLAKVYGYRGETDKAFEWLNQAAESDRVALLFLLSSAAYRSLHSDPRWQPLLKKVNLLEYWLEMPPEWGGPT